jgi:hypothetical protein
MTAQEALAWLWNPDEGEVEQFDRMAAQFRAETGFMRPGKDEPAPSGHGKDERYEAWTTWCATKSREARAAVAKLVEDLAAAEKVREEAMRDSETMLVKLDVAEKELVSERLLRPAILKIGPNAMCTWCTWTKDGEVAFEEMRAHILECEHHPLAQMRQTLDLVREQVEANEGEPDDVLANIGRLIRAHPAPPVPAPVLVSFKSISPAEQERLKAELQALPPGRIQIVPDAVEGNRQGVALGIALARAGIFGGNVTEARELMPELQRLASDIEAKVTQVELAAYKKGLAEAAVAVAGCKLPQAITVTILAALKALAEGAAPQPGAAKCAHCEASAIVFAACKRALDAYFALPSGDSAALHRDALTALNNLPFPPALGLWLSPEEAAVVTEGIKCTPMCHGRCECGAIKALAIMQRKAAQ